MEQEEKPNFAKHKNKLDILRKLGPLHFLYRVARATSYYNKSYPQILRWAVHSREDTNYTYDITDANLVYLAHTISIVCGKPYQEIRGFIDEVRLDKELAMFIIERTAASPFAKSADLRCDFGRRLGWYALVRALKPRVVVETGVDKGLGAILLCSAVLRNKVEGHVGRYFGTDINPDAGYLFAGKYTEVGEILYGDSIGSLESLQAEIDIFINDSDHSEEYEYAEYQAIKGKLSSGAVIIGDNSHVTDKLAIFSEENGRHFLFFKEVPKDHWYPGAGMGLSFK